MKEVIKETNRDIRIKIKKQQVDELSTRIKTISTKGEPFKEIRRLTGKQRRSCAEGRLKIGDTIVEGEEEKAEELARWYEEIAKEKVPDNANQIEIERKYEEVRAFKSKIKFDMDNPALEPKEEVLTNDKEMEAIRRRINNKKSSGSDGLTNHVIRKLPKYFWDCTTIMFNNCLVNGYFPKKWKTATIIPLLKTSKAEIPNDYRPISLLSNWGKCLEDVILNRLKNDEDEVVGVPAHQFAYKRGHSAVHAVDILGAEIEESRRLRMATVVIALDITKAFDIVWKKGLVYKLSNLGIEAEVKTIIADFLNERKGRVQVGKAVSREFRIERGVPQGSKLGPVLYNIYTGDFKMAINEKQGILNFADDSLLWTRERNEETAVKKATRNFADLSNQMQEWGIEVNKKKTKCVIISGGKKKRIYKRRRIKLRMNEEETVIENERSIKYLGQIINEHGNCKESAENAIRKGRAAYGMLRWIIRNKNMDMKVKKVMYTQLIRPTMEYGQEAWKGRKGNATRLEKLELLERKVLRAMTGLYRKEDGTYYNRKVLFKAAMIEESILEHMTKNAEKYEERKDAHRNEWFRSRMEDLFQRKVRMKVRNEEYERTTKEWKSKWYETAV